MPYQIRNKNKDKKIIIENHIEILELKNTITEMKNALEKLNRRSELTEARISKLGDMLTTLSEEDYSI